MAGNPIQDKMTADILRELIAGVSGLISAKTSKGSGLLDNDSISYEDYQDLMKKVRLIREKVDSLVHRVAKLVENDLCELEYQIANLWVTPPSSN
jgi:hypothetical protein